MTALELLKSTNRIAFGKLNMSPLDISRIENTIDNALVLLRKENGDLDDFRAAFSAVKERIDLKMACTTRKYTPFVGSDEDLQEIEVKYGSQD